MEYAFRRKLLEALGSAGLTGTVTVCPDTGNVTDKELPFHPPTLKPKELHMNAPAKHNLSVPAGSMSISQIKRHVQGTVECAEPTCTRKISGNKVRCSEHATENNDAQLIDILKRVNS